MTEQTPIRIGIIDAMDAEVASLREEANAADIVRIADMEFCEGRLDGRDVVIAKCGMGKVNAGICAQIMVTRFGVNRIINTGVAGSLDPRLRIGDFVISTEAVQHDYDVSPIGFEKGEIGGRDAARARPPGRKGQRTGQRRLRGAHLLGRPVHRLGRAEGVDPAALRRPLLRDGGRRRRAGLPSQPCPLGRDPHRLRLRRRFGGALLRPLRRDRGAGGRAHRARDGGTDPLNPPMREETP